MAGEVIVHNSGKRTPKDWIIPQKSGPNSQVVLSFKRENFENLYPLHFSIFSNGSNVGKQAGKTDTILKGDHPSGENKSSSSQFKWLNINFQNMTFNEFMGLSANFP